METVLGLKGRDCVVLACDTMLAKSVYFLSDDKSKIRRLSDHSIVAAIGDNADSTQFTNFIMQKSMLYEMRNGYHMAPSTMAHFTRNTLVETLRKNIKCQISMLMASCDNSEGPHLAFIDAQGSSQNLNYCGHGYGNLIANSIFRMLWQPDLTNDQAIEIIRKCVQKIQSRLVINLRNFEIFVVDKNGVRQIEA